MVICTRHESCVGCVLRKVDQAASNPSFWCGVPALQGRSHTTSLINCGSGEGVGSITHCED